ncbi:MAG: hypothetical protein ABIE84_02555 [bacterium]
MIDVSGIGAFGIIPFMSDDVLKQAKLSHIKTKAGRLAYIMSLGKKAQKPQIHEGVHEARGALKWISEILKEEEK